MVDAQNDRVYAASNMRKGALPVKRLLTTRSIFSQSVMVLVGVSMMGCTDLIFVEPGIKINGQYYRDVYLLITSCLPSKASLETTSYSSRTVLHLTGLVKPLLYSMKKLHPLLLLCFGLLTVQI